MCQDLFRRFALLGRAADDDELCPGVLRCPGFFFKAARRAAVTITVDEGNADTAEDIFTAMLAADQFHTFAEWKRMGYSVKKGQHAALTCQLWKYTDKPGKAAREAAEADGKDAPETDPHFYMTKAHLFHALQVEKSKR